jgi:hypothetical protein
MPVLTIGGGMPVLTIGRADADRPGRVPTVKGAVKNLSSRNLLKQLRIVPMNVVASTIRSGYVGLFTDWSTRSIFKSAMPIRL